MDLLKYPAGAALALLLIAFVLHVGAAVPGAPPAPMTSYQSAFDAKAWVSSGMTPETIERKLGTPESKQSLGIVGSWDYWYYPYPDGRLQICFYSGRVYDANVY